jgi:hypothetical protein
VFGVGGYFEAVLSCDPAMAAQAKGPAAPAFYLEAIHHIVGHEQDQWPGQAPGYAHFGEIDNDWSGVWNDGYPYDIWNRDAQISPGPAPKWNKTNKFGLLWVPQDGANPGFVTWYFNDQPGLIIYWKQLPAILSPPLPGQATGNVTSRTPVSASSTYSIVDQKQFAIQIRTDPAWPLTFHSVKVWQR